MRKREKTRRSTARLPSFTTGHHQLCDGWNTPPNRNGRRIKGCPKKLRARFSYILYKRIAIGNFLMRHTQYVAISYRDAFIFRGMFGEYISGEMYSPRRHLKCVPTSLPHGFVPTCETFDSGNQLESSQRRSNPN